MTPYQSVKSPQRSRTGALALVLDYGIKIAAIGVVPSNRQPSSSSAWLLLILLVPVIGLPLFLLVGNPYVRGRHQEIQAEAIRSIKSGREDLPDSPDGIDIDPSLVNLFSMNRSLTGLPATTGVNKSIESAYEASIQRMADAVDAAERDVNVEVYAMAWDSTTSIFFDALVRAATRGVVIRILLDPLGSVTYPGFTKMTRRLTAAGIQWHLLMPIKPFKGQWRRPDLRNHRKLVVIDDHTAFMDSQNVIESDYLSKRNQRIERHSYDVTIELTGSIVASLATIFHTDLYTESGERLDFERENVTERAKVIKGHTNIFQLVPSGPGHKTEPTLALFTALIYRAQHRLTICSPHFVPHEALLTAVTAAALTLSSTSANKPTNSLSVTRRRLTTTCFSMLGYGSSGRRNPTCCVRSSSRSTRMSRCSAPRTSILGRSISTTRSA